MKLTKLLIGSAVALPATIVPLSTITSCAQSWGNLSAFSIGGASTSEGPYTFINDRDFDGVLYSDYLQSNYSIKQSSSSAYAYSSPMKWDKDKKDWVLGESAWYQAGSSAFQTTATYKDAEGKAQKSTNARNAALSTNISFISSIGSAINNYLSNALRFQSSQVSVAEKQNKESIKAAWGCDSTKQFSLDFDSMSDTQIQNFFENSYANANLNGSGKATAMLRTANVNFYFNTLPVPAYKFNGTPSKDTRNGLSVDFVHNLEGNQVGEYTSVDDFNYYSRKSGPIGKDEDEHYELQYYNVPYKVTLKNLTQSYLNPQLSNPFLVNDYYSSDKQVRETIGNQWKTTMPEITGCKESEAIPQYKTFKWNASSNSFDITQENADKRLGGASNGRDFIVLLNYNVNIYTASRSKDSAIISGISNIFPASWLDIFGDTKNLYKTVRQPKDQEDAPPYCINSSVITNLATNFNNVIKNTSGKRAKDLDQTSKNFLSFLGYMFSNNGTIEGSNIDDILKSQDKINL